MITFGTTGTTEKDMNLCVEYTGDFFDFPEKLPVSFYYCDRFYNGLPKNSKIRRRFIDANIIETVMSGTVGDALQVNAECLTYRDYPVVEWTVYFSCVPGNERTGMLENVLSADMVFENKNDINNTNPVLVYNNGDFYSKDGYTVGYLEITEDTEFSQSPAGGRPCDRAFPYQRVIFNGKNNIDKFGFSISIGWPGQWSCEYKGFKDSYGEYDKKGFTFKAGQEVSRTYIKSGETFRTPRMTMMVFDGDETRGINIWRRWFNTHVTPRHNGKILEPKSVLSDNNGGIEFQEATEENQLSSIAYAKENFPEIKLWWIDAGWYPCKNADGKKEWTVTGDWIPDPERFPNGFAPVGKACKDAGIELLVWFEPERVHKDSKLCKEHPEWMIAKNSENWSYLLNIANPDCHKWLRETVSKIIKESGITCYRQDYNFEPLNYWRDNEENDRKGMLENLYIQGYLAYWDYLLINIPDLWIDSCSSGGRRNDMETMRRSVPLHPTDYGYGYHHVNQAFRHTLQSWFPFTRGWTGSWDKNNEYYNHDDYYMADAPSLDNYKMINGFGSLTFFASIGELKYLSGDLPYVRKLHNIWEKYAEMQMNGDFYALTENHRDNTKWTVFQFDCPEKGRGVIQVLRNNQSKDESITVMPHGLFAEEKSDLYVLYVFSNEETGEIREISAEEINKNGMTFTQPVRSGSIWFYWKKSLS